MPAGAVASAPSSAAQQSTPPSRPRYRVRAGSEPNQSWLFCNGSFAQAGPRAHPRVVARALERAHFDQQLVAGEHEPVAAFALFVEAERLEARRRAEGKLDHAAEYNLHVSMLSPVAPPVSEAELANAIRALAMDAVEAAKSGHPGMPMGMAEIAVALWKRHLRHNPANPAWPNRDRFVLSNGHGSMLLYSLLHLTGYALPMEELKRFRQLGSKTPGHPERGCAPGVETTTGPLGQGLANAVGMALAERLLATRFNRPGHDLVDHMHVRVPRRRLHDGRHLARGLRARRDPRAGQAAAPSTTTTASRSTRTRARSTSGTPTTCRRRFEAYGWHLVGPRRRP